MVPHLALSLAAVLLVADPVPDPTVAPAPEIAPQANAEQLATQLGLSMGAAKECAMGDRADAAMAKATQMVDQAAAAENTDSLDMNDRFHDAMEDGRDAILNGSMSCEQADSALKQIEGQRPD